MIPDNSPIEVFADLTSTNDSILAAGADGCPEGTTHVALTQSAGRGRSGRRWWSPAGAGLWMSVLLRPDLPRQRWPELALVAGVGAKAAIQTWGVQAQLEWPNDLVARGRKLGGILCEVRSSAETAWIALGIGINIDLLSPEASKALPPEIQPPPICMHELGAQLDQDPKTLARQVLRGLDPVYSRFLDGADVRTLASKHLAHLGKAVTVRLPDETILEGRVDGLTNRGELVVISDKTRHKISVGDVEYCDK